MLSFEVLWGQFLESDSRKRKRHSGNKRSGLVADTVLAVGSKEWRKRREDLEKVILRNRFAWELGECAFGDLAARQKMQVCSFNIFLQTFGVFNFFYVD